MGNLAAEHERNVEGSALVRAVQVKCWEDIQEACGGYTSFGELVPPKGASRRFNVLMRSLCGEMVTINCSGNILDWKGGEHVVLEPWMYDEMETPDSRVDERLRHNEEYQRKKAEPRLGPCLSCGEIKVLDMEGAMGECSECLSSSRAVSVHRDYGKLYDVLVAALEQAQSGKGKERHAAGEPFEQQEICQNTRAVGYGYPLGQARKKARESLRLLEDRGPDAAIAECLGAINYLAAAIIVMQEKGGEA